MSEAVGQTLSENALEKKLPPEDRQLYRRCDEVLHYLWDPIGVSDQPAARDEYSTYLPQVFSLVKREASESEIANYLITVERDKMGLFSDPNRAREIARLLIQHRKYIHDRRS